MAIEGGNFTTAFFKEDSVRDLFNVEEQQQQPQQQQQQSEKISVSKSVEKEEIVEKVEKDGSEKKPPENDLTNEQYEKVFIIIYHSFCDVICSSPLI